MNKEEMKKDMKKRKMLTETVYGVIHFVRARRKAIDNGTWATFDHPFLRELRLEKSKNDK